MKEIPTTYFCITPDELRAKLRESGLDGLIAVRPTATFSTDPPTLPKFVDVLEDKGSFIVAARPQDVSFVTAASWWRRFYLAFRTPRAASAPSLQNSKNAALLMVSDVDEVSRHVTPGFVSSYPGKSELYQRLKSDLTATLQLRDGFLVSRRVAALLDQGFQIWVG